MTQRVEFDRSRKKEHPTSALEGALGFGPQTEKAMHDQELNRAYVELGIVLVLIGLLSIWWGV